MSKYQNTTLEGSFLAVSKSIFANEFSICSIFEIYQVCALLHFWNPSWKPRRAPFQRAPPKRRRTQDAGRREKEEQSLSLPAHELIWQTSPKRDDFLTCCSRNCCKCFDRTSFSVSISFSDQKKSSFDELRISLESFNVKTFDPSRTLDTIIVPEYCLLVETYEK